MVATKKAWGFVALLVLTVGTSSGFAAPHDEECAALAPHRRQLDQALVELEPIVTRLADSGAHLDPALTSALRRGISNLMGSLSEIERNFVFDLRTDLTLSQVTRTLRNLSHESEDRLPEGANLAQARDCLRSIRQVISTDYDCQARTQEGST